jgi:hypothetical protein
MFFALGLRGRVDRAARIKLALEVDGRYRAHRHGAATIARARTRLVQVRHRVQRTCARSALGLTSGPLTLFCETVRVGYQVTTVHIPLGRGRARARARVLGGVVHPAPRQGSGRTSDAPRISTWRAPDTPLHPNESASHLGVVERGARVVAASAKCTAGRGRAGFNE